MKPSFFTFLAIIVLIFIQCKDDEKPQYPFSFQFYTEEYKPFNYLEAGELKGLAPNVLNEICTELNIPFEVEVKPWDEAYAKTLETNNAVLFSTVLNAERKDLFKWAGPIAYIDWFFYTSAKNPLTVSSLENAKSVGKIGVINDYAITQYLKAQGFTNLVYLADNKVAFDKLIKGEIDIFPSDHLTAEAAIADIGHSYYSVNPKFRLLTDLVYFAFNKNISDDVVADFQNEIDHLKENGKLKSLCQEYMGSSDFPESLIIYTEQYPPLTFLNSYGETSGFGTDIVREIMKRNNVYADIALSQWRIGYELALNNPNVCLFTMDRTPIREPLFQWVGPLGSNSTYFYTKSGTGVTIKTLDDAKTLGKVGTVSSWFSDQYLRNLGFTNLVSDGDPMVLTGMLMKGEIDAFVCSGLTFFDILGGLGYKPDQTIASFQLMSSDFYIAFSKGTPTRIVNQWQQTLESMKMDGTYPSICMKWFQQVTIP